MREVKHAKRDIPARLAKQITVCLWGKHVSHWLNGEVISIVVLPDERLPVMYTVNENNRMVECRLMEIVWDVELRAKYVCYDQA